MHEVPIPRTIEPHYLRRGGGLLLAGVLVVIGVVAFVLRLGSDPDRAWQAYVSNWLFFTSISEGALLLCAATVITKSRWNWSVRRVSLAMGAFAPVSFLLLLPMLTLRENYFPWIDLMATDEVLQKKAAYLNIPFLVTRNVVGGLLLFGLSLVFIYLSLRPDLGPGRGGQEAESGPRAGWRRRLTGGWTDAAAEEAKSWGKLKTLAPAFVLVYAAIMSMFAIDWAMSLDPHWFSTVFPAWYFMGGFWGGIIATALVSVLLRRRSTYAHEHISAYQLHDLGKLTFGFSIFWTYLFWSQYLVIWYGKLPWEQQWIVERSGPEFGFLSLLVIALCFIVPFAALIGRKPKLIPGWLGTITALGLVGLWLEMYLYVAPSLHQPGTPTLTIWEPLIGLGFLGLFGGVIHWFLRTFPLIQTWQHPVDAEMVEMELAYQVDFSGSRGEYEAG